MTCGATFHAWTLVRVYTAEETFPVISARTPDEHGSLRQVAACRSGGAFVFTAGTEDIDLMVSVDRDDDQYIRVGTPFLRCSTCGEENHNADLTYHFNQSF